MPKNNGQLQIRKRIQLQEDRSKMDKLCLDEISITNFTPIVKQLLQSCLSLQYLTINACQLVSLDSFPLLPSLITLELSANRLRNGLQNLRTSGYITFLDLSDNQFEEISQLKALTCLPELEILIVAKNPAAQLPDYRQQLFSVLPALTTVDCYNRDDQLLSSQGEQSYITDKYHSLNNMDDIGKEKDGTEVMKSKESLVDIAQQYNPARNKSLEKSATKKPLKNIMRRQRFLEDSSSEQEGPNSMINQFKRKFRKQE